MYTRYSDCIINHHALLSTGLKTSRKFGESLHSVDQDKNSASIIIYHVLLSKGFKR